MKEISDVRTTNVYVFEQDNLPSSLLLTKVASNLIKEAFHFQSIAQIPEGGVDFSNGIFVKGDSKIAVDRLQIELRKISISIAGESSDLDAVFAFVMDAVTSLVPSFKPEISVTTKQTACSVRLGFPFTTIFDKRFLSFIENYLEPATELPDRRHQFEFKLFRGVLRYQDKDLKHRIPISPKDFVIEPRVDTDPSENRYFTVSPTDSPTHFKLIEAFENSFLRKR